MTDYPTREAIDAAAETIYALQLHVDRDVPGRGATWSGLETAREILVNLDDAPGLHYPAEPKPEPKPTAAEVLRSIANNYPPPVRRCDVTSETTKPALEALRAAHEQALAQGLTAQMHILAAASIYAEEHPEWFTKWDQYDKPCDALDRASWEAQLSGHAVFTATFTLTAAASVATHHPHLFGVLQ